MLWLSDAFISINFRMADHVLIHGVIIKRGTSPSLHVNLAPSDVSSFLVECFPGFSRKPDSHSSMCEQWLCLPGSSQLLFLKWYVRDANCLDAVRPDVFGVFFLPLPFYMARPSTSLICCAFVLERSACVMHNEKMTMVQTITSG